MDKETKKPRRFSLLRFLLVIFLKDLNKAEGARQYILGKTSAAKEYEEFEKWRFRKHCAERGVKLGSDPAYLTKR